jgi:CHAT domain-containing protein
MTLGESRQKAIARFNEALPDWRAAADSRGEAMTYFRIGSVYKQLGDNKMALENFDKGLAIQLEPRDWRLTAGMLNDSGVVYESMNQFDRALALLGQAKRLFEANGDRRGQASAHNNVAHVFGTMGKPSEALKEFHQALLLRQLEHDQNGEINVLNNMGGIYNLLGDPHLALEHFNHALELWKQLGNRNKIPVGFNNTAVMLEKLGEWQKAIDNYNAALDGYRQIGDRSGEADTLDNLGDMYESLGDRDQALDYYTQALQVVRNFVGSKGTEANVLAHMARLNASENKLDEALKNYNESLSIPQSKRRQAESLTGIGAVYALKGNLAEALNYYERALKLRKETEDSKGEAVTLDRMAQALFLSGKRDEALESYKRAVTIWRKVEDQLGLASSLEGISLVQHAAGNLAESLKLTNEAISIVESLRTKVTNHQLRTSYFATKQNYYEHLIDIQMDLYQKTHSSDSIAGAIEASERSRARSLIDTLTEGRIDFARDSNVELLHRRREVQGKIQAKSAALTQMLNGAPNKEQLQLVREDLARLIAEDTQAWDKIKASNPKYAALVQPAPLTAAQIQQLLDDGTLLLQYALGEKRSYVWAVTSNSLHGFELAKSSEIESVAQRMTEALTVRNRDVKNEIPADKQLRIKKAETQYAEASVELSKMVLDPVAALLGQKRLAVVADGALQSVPFAALPLPDSTNADSLISKHEIITLPSASVLALQRRELANRKPAPFTIAIVADPVYEETDSRLVLAGKTSTTPNLPTSTNGSAPTPANSSESSRLATALRDTGVDGKLSRLPWSGEEAKAIGKLVPRNENLTALGFKANRQNATSAELSKYRFIHFATHGIMDLEHPELSGIVFSMFDEKGRAQDGYVRLHEIYNLNLPAELVVLSACQTGVGKQIKGEGLIALTRGFMYAGAKSIVASLWKVDDAATSQLMAEFYKQIFINKLKPAAALRAAQLKMSQEKRWRSPYYWAGFFLQGEWN